MNLDEKMSVMMPASFVIIETYKINTKTYQINNISFWEIKMC